eukprot:2555613-Pyramimonas_sp.AAC.1
MSELKTDSGGHTEAYKKRKARQRIDQGKNRPQSSTNPRTRPLTAREMKVPSTTFARNVHTVALYVHTFSRNVHTVAHNVHTVALNVHTFARNVHTVARNVHPIARNVHIPARSLALPHHAKWP